MTGGRGVDFLSDVHREGMGAAARAAAVMQEAALPHRMAGPEGLRAPSHRLWAWHPRARVCAGLLWDGSREELEELLYTKQARGSFDHKDRKQKEPHCGRPGQG